jgi:hypothetical protein
MLHWSSWPEILKRLRELPAEDTSIDVVEPARLDTVEGDRCEVIEVEPLSLGHGAVLLAEVEVGHRRVIGVERGEQSRFAHRLEWVFAQAREPIGDDDVAVGADGHWDSVGRHTPGQRRILHNRDPVVDALQAKHVEADQGWSVLPVVRWASERRTRVQVFVRKLGAIDRWSCVKSFGAMVVTGGQWYRRGRLDTFRSGRSLPVRRYS